MSTLSTTNLKNPSSASNNIVLDSSARVLVGTSSSRTVGDARALQVEGTDGATAGLSVFRNSNNSSSSIFVFGKSRGTAAGGTTIVQSGDGIGEIQFWATDGTNPQPAAIVKAEVDGTPGANDMPGRLVFSTTADGAASPTERLLIGNAGRLYATCNDTASASITLRKGAAGADGIDYLQCRDSGNNAKLVIASTGNVQNTNGSYTSFSDAKLKENIVDANSQWADIKTIQIRNWNFKQKTGYETHRQIGPIAQELETVCPNLVFDVVDRDDEGNDQGTVTKGVNQSVLYMKAVKALQEAMERIEALEAKVTALEGA
jgi:hypothetical protein